MLIAHFGNELALLTLRLPSCLPRGRRAFGVWARHTVRVLCIASLCQREVPIGGKRVVRTAFRAWRGTAPLWERLDAAAVALCAATAAAEGAAASRCSPTSATAAPAMPPRISFW